MGLREIIEEIEQGKFSCPACPAKFPDLHSKKRHLKSEHSRGGKRGR